ncbi:Purine nucleoside phosphorylase [Nostocoides australiense Ben110]|uniref:Purine nucleoside phosphorylase n=1 Tax=Nostocoides australiense Ben110 TaxID=1193182 RepID=W6JTL1_9MICO|nr:S-methyl-5'-thioadenosine phosphorylase [Tetrasphaera australiensis]CCH72152.1 Purine nucleoside phosphorylase [Tetrasphaera australiensis Ben110]
MTANDQQAEIGVIGGSGFYSFFEGAPRHRVETPFGAPSDEIAIADLGGRRVAFVARHGAHHQFAPHRVNYRANLWALRSLGVRQVLSPCAVGSLRPELGPGSLVVPDQVVDRTSGRAHTVYDEPGPVVHVSFAHPYCERGRAAVLSAVREDGRLSATDGGTLVVVGGPRFSSAAESRMHQAQGWSIVGMTAMPEAALARELAMCFTTVALVTDHDAGIDGVPAVNHADVLTVFAQHMQTLKDVLRSAVATLPPHEPDESATCPCRRALDGLKLPFELP